MAEVLWSDVLAKLAIQLTIVYHGPMIGTKYPSVLTYTAQSLVAFRLTAQRLKAFHSRLRECISSSGRLNSSETSQEARYSLPFNFLDLTNRITINPQTSSTASELYGELFGAEIKVGHM